MSKSGVEIIPAVLPSEFPVPAIIASAGSKASEHFLEMLRRNNPQQKHARGLCASCRAVLQDYFSQGRRGWVRLHEKGGKEHEAPCVPKFEAYLDACIAAAGIADDKDGPLFRTGVAKYCNFLAFYRPKKMHEGFAFFQLVG